MARKGIIIDANRPSDLEINLIKKTMQLESTCSGFQIQDFDV